MCGHPHTGSGPPGSVRLGHAPGPRTSGRTGHHLVAQGGGENMSSTTKTPTAFPQTTLLWCAYTNTHNDDDLPPLCANSTKAE